jgi:5'/3'-nucleotidase SurE
MRVLITNDDGYRAPGLRALAECVSALGWEATVVAPSAPMSGAFEFSAQAGYLASTDGAPAGGQRADRQPDQRKI